MASLREVRKRLPFTPGQIAKKIRRPLKNWPGKCFEVAQGMVKRGLVEGVAVYGHWRGAISPTSIFKNRAGIGFCRHGWIDVGDRGIVDPTRWVFEGLPPYIYIGRNSGEYDEGGNVVRKALQKPPPRPKKNDVRIPTMAIGYRLDGEAIQWLQVITMDKDALIGLTKEQTFWVANLSLDVLGDFAKEIYDWLTFHGRGAYIPIDNQLAVGRAHGGTEDGLQE